jgi:N-acetylneuraminate synthase/N,N'-diacetyllegionaminate synthase
MNDTIYLGRRPVGDGHPAYIVAEIGINHGGDIALAIRMIDAAKKSGADAVKFQNYKTEDFVPTRNETHTYISQGKSITEPQFDMFKRFELNDKQVTEIAEYCNSENIDFHSTPTNRDGVSLLKNLGVSVLKNGSDYLSNLPLIAIMAKSGLPTVLSTGMATELEIAEAVDAFHAAGGKDLILLHCVSQYPAPLDELRLRRIPALRKRFNHLVGFSDHSNGVNAAPLAIALGACWIEKHFTLDQALPGPDHIFSCTPDEMKELVREIRAAEQSLSFPLPAQFSEAEEESRSSFRLSCAAATNLDAGASLTASDIAFFRPGTGFPPKDYINLVGRVLVSPVRRGDLYSNDSFI